MLHAEAHLVVLARRHQVKLVADTLPPFERELQEFPKLLVADLAVRVHQLEQAGQHSRRPARPAR